MAVNLATVTGNLETLIGGTPSIGRLWFRLTMPDWNDDGNIFAPQYVEAVADPTTGAFSVSLQSTDDFEVGATYRAILKYFDIDGLNKEYELGAFAVGTGGPFELTDLLAVPVVEPVPADILALALAAQTAAENAASAASASAATAQLYGPLTFPDSAAFLASAAPDVSTVGKRAGTQDGLAWDIVAAGTGDFDHPVTGVGVAIVEGGSGAVVADQAGADRTGVASATAAVAAILDADSPVADLRPGEYLMVPGTVSPFTFANSAYPVHRAVALTRSGQIIRGSDATLHGVSRPGVGANDLQPVFATDKETDRNAVTDLTFDGVIWDSENDADAVNSNQRFLYTSGLTRLRLLSTTALSSGNRRGYFAHIHNAADVQIIGHRHEKVTGGLNFRFVNRVILADAIFHDFSEAVDFDGTQEQIIAANLQFEGTARTSQAMDLNGCVDTIVSTIVARMTGNVATIQHKDTTPDNYADYLSNAFVRNITRADRVHVRGVVGEQIGTSVVPSFLVGWDWSAGSQAGAGAPRDVSIGDVALQDTSHALIREAENLHINNMTMRDVITPSGYGAVDLRSSTASPDQIAWSDLSAVVRDLRIIGGERGGLRISTASRLVLDGLVTRGLNTLGGTDKEFSLLSCEVRGTIASIDNLDCDGDIQISGDSTVISAWAADTYYQTGKIVVNGGLYYRATVEGRSASSGGPTGTGLTDVVDDGTAGIPAWANSTAYSVGNLVSHGGAYFVCHTAGTSAGSGGPSGTDQRIQDGTVVWRPINGAARWRWTEKPYKIMWGKGNRIRGTVTLSADAERHIEAEVASSFLGNLAATGTVLMPFFTARRRMLVTHASYITAANVVADGTNYRNLILRRARAGVTANISTIDTASTGFTALVNRDAPLKTSVGASFPTGAYLEPGDILLVNSNHAASGVAMTGLGVTVHYMEF